MKFNNVLKSLKTSLAIVLVVILASCAKQLPRYWSGPQVKDSISYEL